MHQASALNCGLRHQGLTQQVLATASSASTTVSGLIAGTYVFQLKATGSNNLSCTATVTITVNAASTAPTVSAESNQTITSPTSSVTLTGSATASSGTITTYLWTQTSGPNTATFGSASSASTTASGLITGIYVFQLKATGSSGLSGTATTTVTVNASASKQKVTVKATASPATMTMPSNSTTLTATVTDPAISNPTFNNWWSEQSGPNSAKIKSQPKAVTTVTGLIAGTYVFYISITDANGTATATVTVTVNSAANSSITENNEAIAENSSDAPPIANAGNDTTISFSSGGFILDGSSSAVGPNSIANYHWALASGSNNSTIESADSSIAKVTGMTEGQYIFTLTVTDNRGNSSTDSVKITVEGSKEIFLSQSLTLYPNPTTGNFNLQLSSSVAGTMWVFIYDALGNIVFMHQYDKQAGYFSTPINVSTLVKGTYTLQAIIQNQTRMNAKFVKL